MDVPKEAVADWKEHEVTKAVLKRLKENYKEYQALLCAGSTVTADSADTTAIRTAGIVSRIDELRSILDGVGEEV